MDKNVQRALLDALIQHQTYLYRASSQTVNEITAIFDKHANQSLTELLDLLEDLTESERNALRSMDFESNTKTSRSLERVKTLVVSWFAIAKQEMMTQFVESATSLAVYEANHTAKIINEALPKTVVEKAYSNAASQPYANGKLIKNIFTNNDRQKVENVIRDGVSQGQTNQQIVKRIKGTKKADYKDGLLDKSRQAIGREVRTARSHISNATYIDTYKALGVTHLKVVATLDGRTCKTCAFLDGEVYEVDDPKRPRFPIHEHNRTTYAPCGKDGQLIGRRSFVADERKVKDIPKDERMGKIGQVDANTKFKTWFDDQDEDFQRQWLGKSKYKLYKEGNYPIDKFVDPLNKRGYTLAELKEMDQKTFEAVGL